MLVVGLDGDTDEMFGVCAVVTLKENCPDRLPSGFRTWIFHVLVALSVALKVNELEVTFSIWVPERVVVPPFGNVTFTVKPETKLLPKTFTFWSVVLVCGVEGEMDDIDGAAKNASP